jgi:hypothetical protein
MPEEQEVPKQPLINELPADAIVQDSTISPSETQTPDMEVHHHPDVQHKRKNFREYFLEFLMIFLAVTMGFFAENIREYFSDNGKEKQYLELLVDDLKKDTAALNYSIRRLQINIEYGDSLVVLFAHNKLNEKNCNHIDGLTISSGHSVDMIFNDRASSQLKNSGSMRLIRNKNVADIILQYWNNQIRLNQIHDRYETIRMEHHRIGFKTFNWYKGNYIYAPGRDTTLLHLQEKAIIDDKYLNEFVNVAALLYNSGKTQYMPRLTEQLELATNLIDLIRKQYSLGGD